MYTFIYITYIYTVSLNRNNLVFQFDNSFSERFHVHIESTIMSRNSF